jgi:acetyl esterase/lipase
MNWNEKGIADNKIEGVTVFNDILYIADSLHKKHFLDIYVPSNINDTDMKAPVIFFVHGGGWKRGDRKWDNWPTRSRLYKNVGYACAKKGFVCVVISYRLSSLGRKKEHSYSIYDNNITLNYLLCFISISLLFY